MAREISRSSIRPLRNFSFNQPRGHRNHQRRRDKDLLRELATKILQSSLPNAYSRLRLARQFSFDQLGADPYPTSYRDAFAVCSRNLVTLETNHIYSVPELSPAGDTVSNHMQRTDIRARLDFFASGQELEAVAAWRSQLQDILALITRAFPRRRPTDGVLTISVPLYTQLTDPINTIDEIVRQASKLASITGDPTIRLGTRLGDAIVNNLLAHSRLSLEEADRRPYRIVWPAASKLSISEVLETYLSHTPLLELLKTPVEITIPNNIRAEHSIVTATIGHGKTQLMQSIILKDLDDPACPGKVIIDSQGDCIQKYSKMARFDPAVDNSLIMIDPTDPVPPALNLFSWDRRFADTLSEQDREEYLAGVIEMFEFVAAGLLGAELTARMSVVFRFICQLLILIPDANITTLISLLEDPAPYMQYIEELSPTARTFIEGLFSEQSEFRKTRQHIAQRLYHVISSRPFERMFAHPENKFDIRTALNDGKFILINTSKSFLKREWSSIFGRFWIAQIMQASYSRAFIPEHQRRMAHIHIDEAHEYCDENIEQLLIQGRKYKTSVSLYHQTMDQMHRAGLKATALAVPAIRYTGSLNDADANLLSREMKTSPEFLKDVRKTSRGTEWSVFVRNLTPTAAKFSIPFLEVERQPKMSEAAYQRLLERNRQLVGSTRPADVVNRRPPNSPRSNDGDDY